MHCGESKMFVACRGRPITSFPLASRPVLPAELKTCGKLKVPEIAVSETCTIVFFISFGWMMQARAYKTSLALAGRDDEEMESLGLLVI